MPPVQGASAECGFLSFFSLPLPHPTPFCLLMKHSPSANHRGKANVQVARDRNSFWFLRTGVYFSHSLGKCLLNICFVPVSLLSPEEVTVNTQTKTLVGTEGDSWCTQAQTSCLLRADRQKERWSSISDRKLPHCEGAGEGRPEEVLLRKHGTGRNNRKSQ